MANNKRKLVNAYQAARVNKHAAQRANVVSLRYLWFATLFLDTLLLGYSIPHYLRYGHLHTLVNFALAFAITIATAKVAPISVFWKDKL